MFRFLSRYRGAVLPFNNEPAEYCCDIGEDIMVLPATDRVILPGLSEKQRKQNSYYYEWDTIRDSLSRNPNCPFRIQHTETNQVSRTLTQYSIDIELLQEITDWVTRHLTEVQYLQVIQNYSNKFFQAFSNIDAPLESLDILFHCFSDQNKNTLLEKMLLNKSVPEQKNLWIQFCCAAILRHQTEWLVFACLFLEEHRSLKKSFFTKRRDGTSGFEFNDSDGRSLLMRATIAGNLDACQVLSVFNQNINQVYKTSSSSNAETALTYAVMGNRLNIFHWLREQGAALFVPGQNLKDTSIYCRALSQKNFGFLKILLEQPALPPMSALQYALNFSLSQQSYEGFPLLLEKIVNFPKTEFHYTLFGLRVTQVTSGLELIDLDEEQRTLLMRVAETGNTALFLLLIQKATEKKMPLGFMHTQIRERQEVVGQKNLIHLVIQSLDLACLESLYEAVGESNRRILLNLTQIYGDFNYLPIDLAVRRNKQEMVFWLLEKQAPLSVFSEISLVSTLDLALNFASEDIIKMLLDYINLAEIPIDDKAVSKKTLLSLIEDPKSANKFKLLLEAGLILREVTQKVSRREDPREEYIAVPLLLVAVKYQPQAIIEYMLSLPEFNIEQEIWHIFCELYYDCNPLHQAAKYNPDVGVSHMLYLNGKFSSIQAFERDRTSFFSWWVIRGKTELVHSFLEKYRVDREQSPLTGPDDWSELHHAAYHASVEQLHTVYSEHSAELQQRAGFGLTPLAVAILGKKPQNVKFLVDAGAQIAVRDSARNNAFHWCAKINDSKTVQYLAQNMEQEIYFSLLGSKNNNQHTPLAVAYFCRAESVFIELLSLGASAETVCCRDQTLVQKIIEDSNIKYAHLLLDHGHLESYAKETLEDTVRIREFFRQINTNYEQHKAQLSAVVIDRYQRFVLAIEHLLYNKARYLSDPNTLTNQTNFSIGGQHVAIHFEYNVFSDGGNLSLDDYFEHLFVTLKTHYELYLAHRNVLAWFNNLPEGVCIDARVNVLAREIETLRAHAAPTIDQLITEAWLAHVPAEGESEDAKNQQVIADVLTRYQGREVIFSAQGSGEEILLLANDALSQMRVRERLLSFIN
jgi:ankyrin repeat protein